MMARLAAIFDMDGVLLDTERLCLTCFTQTRANFGLAPADAVYLACIGHNSKITHEIIGDSLKGDVALDAFMEVWNSSIAASLAAHVPVKEGALALVQTLAARGVRMGVATSTHGNRARDQLQRAGFLTHFECVIGGDEVTRHKPDPEVYLSVAETMGLDITTCAAFEDSDPGIRAALGSGARAVQVPDLKPPSDDTRALGHAIAEDLAAGARLTGLLSGQN